jgi:hypothetical protein
MDPQLKENILNAFGLSGLPPEQQDEIVAKIGSTIFQGVLVKALETMSATEQKDLEARLKEAGDAPDAVLAAMKDIIPNFAELVQEETTRLAEESRRILG